MALMREYSINEGNIMRLYMSMLVLLFLSGCSNKEEFVLFYNDHDKTIDKEVAVNSQNNEKIKFEYKILPHDRISLIVYKHPEFSTTIIGRGTEDKGVIVDSDGVISLPVIEEVHIAGLTQKEARQKIEVAYSRYLKYSKVKLEVLNKRVYVVGEVKNPGEFELYNEKSSLLKIIAKAGDITDDANRKNIFILRESGDKTDVQRINLVDKNSINMANLMILPNDIIYVPPRDMKSYMNEYSPMFRLVGQVLTPFVNIKYLTN